ncbi:unnamed protein product, partial [Ectocarpus sp. 12 AP-2014]
TTGAFHAIPPAATIAAAAAQQQQQRSRRPPRHRPPRVWKTGTREPPAAVLPQPAAAPSSSVLLPAVGAEALRSGSGSVERPRRALVLGWRPTAPSRGTGAGRRGRSRRCSSGSTPALRRRGRARGQAER